MTSNELPSDDSGDRPEGLPLDDTVDAEAWDLSEQRRDRVDDGAVLRDDDEAATDGQFGELRDGNDPDAVEDEDTDTAGPADAKAMNKLESVFGATTADVWATRPEREAEIMGYPQVPEEAAAVGNHNAERQKNLQLTGVYELAGYLQAHDYGGDEDPGMSEANDGSQTWYTDSGNLSIHREPEVDDSDGAVRQRLIDMEGMETRDGILQVQAQRFVPYTEAGDKVEVNVRVRFETDGDRVCWKDLSTGFTKPEDGSPCPEGEEALLGQFAPENLPPGVTVDQAVENLLLSYVWDNAREAFSYASQDYEEGVYDTFDEETDQDTVEANAIAAEIEEETAEDAVEDDDGSTVRNQALEGAGRELLAYERQESKGYDTYEAARAYTNLAEVAGRMGNPELVAGYTQMLEGVDDVPASSLAHAYFIGSATGDPEMLTKLDTLLTSEMVERMKDGTDPYGILGSAGLQQVIREYESRGISPDTLIADRTLNAEQRWMLTLYHQNSTQGTDPDAAQALHGSLQQFAQDGLRDFTPDFITHMTQYTLGMTTDPGLRAQMVEQLTSAVDRLPVSGKTFRALTNVGDQVLQDKELSQVGLGEQLHMLIEIQSEQVSSDYWLMRDRKIWDVKHVAHSELSSGDLIAGIQNSTLGCLERAADERTREALIEDHDMLLGTGAQVYARQGKFAESQDLIAEMGTEEQAGAYETCLRYVKSPLDLARLKPQVDPQIQAYDPDVEMLFEANEARINGGVGAMGAQVTKLADAIARTGDDREGRLLPDASRCRSQAQGLLGRMKEIQPGSELPAARALLNGMRQSAEYKSNLSMLSYTYRFLLEGGRKADRELVYAVIRDSEASAAQKAEQFSALALGLTE